MMSNNAPAATDTATRPTREPVLDLWDSLGCDEALKRDDWFESTARRALLAAFAAARDQRSLQRRIP